MRLVLWGVLTVLAGALGVAWYLWANAPVQLTSPSIAPFGAPPPGSTTAPEPTATAAPSFTAAPSAGVIVRRSAGEVTVEVDEAMLTQQASASLVGQSLGDTPLGPATVRSVAVQLRDGQIRASGTAQVGVTPLPFSLVGTVATESGHVRVTLLDARLSNLPMPASARRFVEQSLQTQVDGVLTRQRLRVRTVTVDDGKLTIAGAPL